MNEVAIIAPPSLPDMSTAEAAKKKINPAGKYLAGLSEKSRRDLSYALSKFAREFFRRFDESTGLWRFGAGELENPLGIEAWKTTDWSQLRNEHIALAKKWVREKGLSQSAEGQYVNALRGVVGQCFELGYIDAGVEMRARRVKAPSPVDHKPGRALNRTEMIRLFQALDEEQTLVRRTRDTAILSLMAWSGLRMVDTQRLMISDVLDGASHLIVHRKGRKVQDLALNPLVTKRVLDWISVRGNDKGPLICKISKGPVIKPASGISKTSYGAIVQKYADMAAIGKITPHDLRSTFAVQLRAQGVPIEEISELMGHSDINTTMIYFRNLDQSAAHTIRALDFFKEQK